MMLGGHCDEHQTNSCVSSTIVDPNQELAKAINSNRSLNHCKNYTFIDISQKKLLKNFSKVYNLIHSFIDFLF